MRYWVVALSGLAICGVSIVGIDWGIYHLIRTGSCGSDGTYVATRPCPPGTGGHILALIGGVFGGLIGVGVFAARGRAGQRRESPYPLALLMWTLLFCTIAGAGLYAVLGPAAGDNAAKGTAIFLAALFIPMGLGPVPFAWMARRGNARLRISGHVQGFAHAGVAPEQHGPRVDARAADARAAHPDAGHEDPLAKIEKLGELRAKGLITEAEFESQKQRLLREV